jgi:heptosyltransferase-3
LNLPLEELAARLAGCHAYLGNDSGVSHLAGLCGARTVVLFGPTSPVVWSPLGPRVRTMTFETQPEEVVAVVRGD